MVIRTGLFLSTGQNLVLTQEFLQTQESDIKNSMFSIQQKAMKNFAVCYQQMRIIIQLANCNRGTSSKEIFVIEAQT